MKIEKLINETVTEEAYKEWVKITFGDKFVSKVIKYENLKIDKYLKEYEKEKIKANYANFL